MGPQRVVEKRARRAHARAAGSSNEYPTLPTRPSCGRARAACTHGGRLREPLPSPPKTLPQSTPHKVLAHATIARYSNYTFVTTYGAYIDAF